MGLKEITQNKQKAYSRIFETHDASLNDIVNFNELSYMQTVVATFNAYAVSAKDAKTAEERKKHKDFVFGSAAVVLKDRSYGAPKDPKLDMKRKTGKQSLTEYFLEAKEKFKEYDFENENYEQDIVNFLKVFSEIFQAWRMQYLIKNN